MGPLRKTVALIEFFSVLHAPSGLWRHWLNTPDSWLCAVRLKLADLSALEQYLS